MPGKLLNCRAVWHPDRLRRHLSCQCFEGEVLERRERDLQTNKVAQTGQLRLVLTRANTLDKGTALSRARAQYALDTWRVFSYWHNRAFVISIQRKGLAHRQRQAHATRQSTAEHDEQESKGRARTSNTSRAGSGLHINVGQRE